METESKIKPEYNKLINEYLQSLSAQETQTLEIAKDHLGSSFNITKSIGFIKWNEKNKCKKE